MSVLYRFIRQHFLVLFFLVFVVVRSVGFTRTLNFSFDQALFSTQALHIWRNKQVVLIGPTASLNFNGRYIFQGPAIYYLQLFFLVLGKFDPVLSSYLFMVLCGVMIWPLYYGVKWLTNKKVALVMLMMYAFFPPFIFYTTFLWNPNFQLAFVPLLLFVTGVFKRKQQPFFFVVMSFLLGFLLQFHYQFLLVILGYFVFFFVYKKMSFKYFCLLCIGVAAGMFPLLLFEVRHQFYNTQTVFLLLQHFNQIFPKGSHPFEVPFHYVLSLSFFALFIVIAKIEKHISWMSVGIGAAILLGWCVFQTVQNLNVHNSWTYQDEINVYQIIRSTHVQDFNIANPSYDTLAHVQKYFFERDNVSFNFDNYTTNHFLFLITKDADYMKNSAYEIHTFTPSSLVRSWKINDTYTLYLLERKLSK